MKTTKKGFTLIELIVVIAIIGVLAAILVPSMLGYVKKSKIQSANSAASTILKACNSALEELDENDKDTSGLTNIKQGSAAAANAATQSEVIDYMKSYFDDVANANFSINIQNGVAICCAAKSGAYYGTSPIVYTNKNYPTSCSLDTALAAAQSKYNVQHPTSTT